MAEAPRSVAEALTYARAQAIRPTEDWTNYCQRFVRSCYGIPALFGSAWLQWLGADAEHKRVGGDPADAPVGAALCYKGSGPYGHIMLAAHPYGPDETPAAWSNDLVTYGRINKVRRTAPVTSWGQPYLGYLTAVNGYTLPLGDRPREQRPERKRYAGVGRAIEGLQAARDTAQRQDDQSDVRQLDRELDKLRELYATLRRR